MEQAVSRETAVHGERWAAQFGGYFSDPRVAEPFLEIHRAGGAGEPSGRVGRSGRRNGFSSCVS
jgi:hypothetical protein